MKTIRNGTVKNQAYPLSLNFKANIKKQPSRGVLGNRCSENMQQTYRTSMPKCDFNKACNFI